MGGVTTRCPCCGHDAEIDRPLVDLDRNVISFRGVEASTRPKVAEFVRVLSDHHPAPVSRSRLIAKIWGGIEPESSESCVRLLAYQARAAMAGWPVTVFGTRGRGYRLNVG